MRYLDENGNEIDSSTIDESLGRFVSDDIVTKHDAIPYKMAEVHYEVQEVVFTDGTKYEPTDNDDPHIRVIDAKSGVFEYVDQGEGKEYFGMGLREVVDVPEIPAQDEWEEIEQVMRYVPYTEEEIVENERKRLEEEAAEKERQQQEDEKARKEAQQKEFLDTAPDKLKYMEETQASMRVTQAETDDALCELYEMILGGAL